MLIFRIAMNSMTNLLTALVVWTAPVRLVDGLASRPLGALDGLALYARRLALALETGLVRWYGLVVAVDHVTHYAYCNIRTDISRKIAE